MTLNQLLTLLFLIIFPTLTIGHLNAQKEIYIADPSIFAENGKYYLTGTSEAKLHGFKLLKSDNLTEWKLSNQNAAGKLLGTSKDVFGERNFWAPQILKADNQYFLTYTANEHIAIAKSTSLTGPYTQTVVQPIDSTAKNIDSYLFKDDDGKYYMYHVRFKNGNFIWVAEFDFANGLLKKETLKQCLRNDQVWEKTQAYKSAPIMEGPTVVKLKGIYYLFYSANNFRSVDYAVGYATATSPYGPWTKHPQNPIIHRSIVHENGAGHGDLFFDKQNNPYYVYHVHNSDSVVAPRKTRIAALQFNLNTRTGIYDISVIANKIIIPKRQ